MSLNIKSLSTIGWEPFLQQQLTTDEWEQVSPYRVIAVHRGQLLLSNGEDEVTFTLSGKILTEDRMNHATIGDWLLLSNADGKFIRMLERKSLFKRKAPGTANLHQLIAANVNTLFIVTSANEEFSISRIERYLALAYEAKAEPVVIITKVDLSEDIDQYTENVRKLDAFLVVETVNALDPKSLNKLHSWCKSGQTIALMGSSGVGKSTIANGLGTPVQKTGKIRDDDAKGRHTTTHRSLLPLNEGGILLDTPGMRELQVTDCEDGVAAVFADIEELSANCRFNDCKHNNEPGCAVKSALESEQLDPRRLSNYNKLQAEQRRNSATLAERRHKDKKLSKFYSRTIKESQKLKGMS